MRLSLLTSFILFMFLLPVYPHSPETSVVVNVVPEGQVWNYNLEENVRFTVNVTKNKLIIREIQVNYELSYDMMTPHFVENTMLRNGKLEIDAGTMQVAGFLRCRVFVDFDGHLYEGRATVAFNPESIVPFTRKPNDFEEYWKEAIEKNAKLPLDSHMRLLPEKCTSNVNVYEINYQNLYSGSRIYGILCVPKTKGKYPALLRVPGAGIRSYEGDVSIAEKEYITLEIGIHGIPVTMDRVVYDNLVKGALNRYHYNGWDRKNNVYFKRVYLACLKAVDFIFSLPEFDGENIVVQGSSQGGALAIVTGALDKRIKGVISIHPGLSDLNAYLYGRAGGWPNLFSDPSEQECVSKLKEENCQYYDVVNFARLLKVPVFYSFGYNDMVCSPTSVYSAYNVIESAKHLMIVPETAHYICPEQYDSAFLWMAQLFGSKGQVKN